MFEAIEKTAQAGGTVIEFFPGQKLSKEEPNVVWDQNASAETIGKVKAKLAQHKIKAVNYGVVDVPRDEAQARKLFEFAKEMGLRAITTESVGALDTIEKMVKEYDIMVGFHDHPKQPDNPDYRMWDPNYVLSVVKDRDPRIGSCADTGHWVRSGLNPLECLRILRGPHHQQPSQGPQPDGTRGPMTCPLAPGSRTFPLSWTNSRPGFYRQPLH